MAKESKNKKLLLGSALAGLMVVAPGIAVTTAPTSDTGAKFFQTVQLETGYGLARAGEGPGDTGDKGTVEQDEEKKEEQKEEASPAAESDDSAKKEGSKSCGAGSCG